MGWKKFSSIDPAVIELRVNKQEKTYKFIYLGRQKTDLDFSDNNSFLMNTYIYLNDLKKL